MNITAFRTSLAASAAIALLTAAAAFPASAETKVYPAGTDCSVLSGNAKTDCAAQMKDSASPDNSNNPDKSGVNNTVDSSGNPLPSSNTMSTDGMSTDGMSTDGMSTGATNSTTKYPAGTDCATLSGNAKTECAQQAKDSVSPDNSNNPDQSN